MKKQNQTINSSSLDQGSETEVKSQGVEPAELVENRDFIYDSNGLFVLTREYLLKRGTCCRLGCHNCPYELDA